MISPRRAQFSPAASARFSGLFLIVGALLFLYVWWPIQAERARKEVRVWDETLAQRKARLQELKDQYKNLMALNNLDEWARRHGPFRSPTSHDIILVQE